MPSVFVTSPAILTGVGAFSELGSRTASLGRKVLLVTGRKGLRQAGVTDRALTLLGRAGCSVIPFEEVAGEPDLAVCDRGRQILRQEDCQVVVALGGGSALDAGKVMAGLAGHTEPTLEFWNGKAVIAPGVPFVSVPTTAGTGSEVTNNGVITNPDKRAKKSIRDERFVARVALVDPELTVTCPPEITAYAGMDALCQAIESFTSRHATPLTDALALAAVELLADGLLAAWREPEDLEARTRNSLGALMAGMALTNARLGLVHGLAHPLGARFGIAHGLVCSVLLPHVMELNRPFAIAKYRQLDHLLGGHCLDRIRQLMEKIRIPDDLRAYRIPPTLFPVIIDEALPSGSTAANPKKVTPEDARQVLVAACGIKSRDGHPSRPSPDMDQE